MSEVKCIKIDVVVGEKYSHLLVLSITESRYPMALCRCDCGKEKRIRVSSIRFRFTHSCGCYRKRSKTKHGMKGTPEYKVWKGINARCNNPNGAGWANYGGRGISVCQRWSGEHGFSNFISDMGLRPSDKHTIDRIDNNGNYEPKNCRWATRSQQMMNTRKSRMMTFDGCTKSMKQWSIDLGIPYGRILNRVHRGHSVENSLWVGFLPRGLK